MNKLTFTTNNEEINFKATNGLSGKIVESSSFQRGKWITQGYRVIFNNNNSMDKIFLLGGKETATQCLYRAKKYLQIRVG